MGYSDEQKRSHIEELQTYLHRISYEDPKIPRVIPDGIYGPDTTAAVRAFQTARGLSIDGLAGPETFRALLG